MKLTIPAPGAAQFEIEGANVKELYTWAAFFQSLPTVCPVDGTPTKLHYREPEGYSYYGLRNTGALWFEANCGQAKEGGSLFFKDVWTWWDAETKQAHTVWENGRITPFGEKLLQGKPTNGNGNGHSAPPASNGLERLKAAKAVEPEIDFGSAPAGTAQRTRAIVRTSYDDILADPGTPDWIVNYVEMMRQADESAAASEKKHNYAVRIVDDVVGKGNHRAALGALLGRDVSSQAPISEGAFKQVLKVSKTLYKDGQPVDNADYNNEHWQALAAVYAWAIGKASWSDSSEIPF